MNPAERSENGTLTRWSSLRTRARATVPVLNGGGSFGLPSSTATSIRNWSFWVQYSKISSVMAFACALAA